MKSEQEIDRLVQQHLLNTESSVGDWDLPSDQVWENVRRRIQKQDRGRGAWWWVFGALLFPIVLVILLQSQKGTGQETEPEQPPQPLSSESNIASAIPVDLHQPDLTARIQDEIPLSNPASEIANVSETSDRNATSLPKHKLKSTASTSAGSTPGFIEEPFRPLEDATALPLSGSTGTSVTDSDLNSTTHVFLPATLERGEVTFLSPLKLVPFTRQLALSHPNPAPMLARPTPRTWSLVAALAPSMSSRRITVPDAQARVRRELLLHEEAPAAQLGFAVSAIREIDSRWSVGVGIEYNRFLLNSASKHQIRYTRAGETLNARGNFENRFNLNLNTSFGELSTDVIIERSSDAQLAEHQFIDLSLETRQSMQVLQFPVSVRYEIPVRRVTMSMQAGISANMLLENTLEFRAIQSLDSDIVQTRTLRQARLSGSRDFALGYHCGVGFEMPLDRRLSILLEPTLSGYLQPVYRNRQVVIYPILMDIHLGVRYKL